MIAATRMGVSLARWSGHPDHPGSRSSSARRSAAACPSVSRSARSPVVSDRASPIPRRDRSRPGRTKTGLTKGDSKLRDGDGDHQANSAKRGPYRYDASRRPARRAAFWTKSTGPSGVVPPKRCRLRQVGYCLDAEQLGPQVPIRCPICGPSPQKAPSCGGSPLMSKVCRSRLGHIGISRSRQSRSGCSSGKTPCGR